MSRNPKLRSTIVSIALLSAGLVGCGQAGESPGQTGESPDQGDGTAAAPDNATEDVTLRFAHVHGDTHPYVECGTQPLVEAMTEVGVNIETFPNGQLGSSNELAQQVVGGSLDMNITPIPVLAEYYGPIGVLNAVYLFESREQAREALEGEIGEELFGGLGEEVDVHVLGNWYYGARQLTTKGTPVRHPDDLLDLRVRAIDNEVQIANIEAMGGTAVPVAFGELYLALQQGIVDAQENPIATIEEQKFTEVQDYLMITDHLFPYQAITISDNAWQTLSEEQQAVLKEEVTGLADDVEQCIVEEEERLIGEWRESGALEIVEDVDREAFRERAQEILPEQFKDDWGDLYTRIRESL